MMKEQKSIRRMNDGELRFYKCMLRLRRERRRRIVVSMFAVLAALEKEKHVVTSNKALVAAKGPELLHILFVHKDSGGKRL